MGKVTWYDMTWNTRVYYIIKQYVVFLYTANITMNKLISNGLDITVNMRASQLPNQLRDHHQHDDVIKWKHFPRYWPFVRGIHRSPVNSPHKGQWRRALMFSLICPWINYWVNNYEAGDLRRHRTHYDVIIMSVAQLWRHHQNVKRPSEARCWCVTIIFFIVIYGPLMSCKK